MLNLHEFMKEFCRAAAHGPSLYFAPIVGAIRYTRFAWKQAEKELRAGGDDTSRSCEQ
jgi:hypothetical protein